MKIVTVVGARPQFIKAAMGSRQLRCEHQEVLIHTGQHFDENMSDVFFDELEIPRPDYNLGISGGSHGFMTARMLEGIESVLLSERPDSLLVYGDTNSTMAAAIAAVKLHIPVIHVEAGNRLHTLSNPEEVNRIITDRVSSLHFCATEEALQNLVSEGLGEHAHFVGNIMYDAFLFFSGKIAEPVLHELNGDKFVVSDDFYYLTCHRQENTFSDEPMTEILAAMQALDADVVYPVHPRNRERALRICANERFDKIHLVEPCGYLESIYLVKNAKKIVTDSGGLQCEAFFAGVQCVFVFDHVAWPETMVGNRNQLAEANRNDIIEKLGVGQTIDPSYRPFGDGHAAEKICDVIREWEI